MGSSHLLPTVGTNLAYGETVKWSSHISRFPCPFPTFISIMNALLNVYEYTVKHPAVEGL
jgi:hypothetical protein